MKNINTLENFLAGETDLLPQNCNWKYKNFASKHDAEDFSKFLTFKGYKVMKIINSNEAKPFLQTTSNL